MDLKALLEPKTPDSIHVETLDTVMEARSVSEAIDRARVDSWLAFGRRWKQDIEAMAQKMEMMTAEMGN